MERKEVLGMRQKQTEDKAIEEIELLLLFGEYLAAGSTRGAISLRKTKPC